MIRRRLIYFILCFSFFLNYHSRLFANDSGGENEYDVKKIPISLLEDANAVIRVRSTQFEVKNQQKAYLKTKIAVTIFKKQERDYGVLILWYDKFHEIEDLEGKIYDANGERVRKLNDDDIKDYGGTDGISLVIDARANVAELYHDQYPYTIEYEYEYSFDGYINWPEWVSQENLDAVEQSRFEVITPKEDSLRYWCNRDSVRPKINLDGNKKIYIWEARNLPKLSKDVVGNAVEDFATIVQIAPAKFEIGGYDGKMSSWKDFGTWYFNLCKGRDALPENAIKEVHSLIQPTDNEQVRIRKLYRYLQERSRYVSVQLGIGGWQPFDAKYVHERSYGDCKALSNYMAALLKEIGVTGYTYLIRAGDYRTKFIEEFPSNQFNHAMVCVPLQQDTIWLECTSQSIPFGHISSSTENRGALLILPDGGEVIHTPKTIPNQNKQEHVGTVELSPSGNANANVIKVSTGDQQDYIRGALDDATPQDRERWILENLEIPNVNLKNYKIDGLETHEIEIKLALQLELPRYASASGNRMFFMPNLMERYTYIPPDVAHRLSPIRYKYPYLDIDSIVYIIPKGFAIESIPKDVHIQTSFGEFSSKTIKLGDTAIVYKRSMEIRDYSVPAEKYTEYRKFYADIVKADRAQVVLVRKD